MAVPCQITDCQVNMVYISFGGQLHDLAPLPGAAQLRGQPRQGAPADAGAAQMSYRRTQMKAVPVPMLTTTARSWPLRARPPTPTAVNSSTDSVAMP